MVVSINRGPQYIPQNAIVLMIWAPKIFKWNPNLGNPLPHNISYLGPYVKAAQKEPALIPGP